MRIAQQSWIIVDVHRNLEFLSYWWQLGLGWSFDLSCIFDGDVPRSDLTMWFVNGSRFDLSPSPDQRCNVSSLSLFLEVLYIPSIRAYLGSKSAQAFSSFVVSVILIVTNGIGFVISRSRILCADIEARLSE